MIVDNLILVDIESLSREDEFLKWLPRTREEAVIKNRILRAIDRKLKNFYKPMYAPSIDEKSKKVCFEPGKRPAIGMSYYNWCSLAFRYRGGLACSIESELEHAAFLGFLMKKIIAKGMSLEWTWNALCNDSSEFEMKFRNDEYELGLTGSSGVEGFYDLCIVDWILNDHDGAHLMWISGNRRQPWKGKYSISTLSDCYIEQYSGGNTVASLIFRPLDSRIEE